MTGYDRQVRSRIGNINRETIMLARSTREVVGENAVSVFQVIRTLGVPLLTTYFANNGSGKKRYERLAPEEYDEISE